MVDGLNFKDFVASLSPFSQKATIQQKIECNEFMQLNIFEFRFILICYIYFFFI
jgi:hypothetical protein